MHGLGDNLLNNASAIRVSSVAQLHRSTSALPLFREPVVRELKEDQRHGVVHSVPLR